MGNDLEKGTVYSTGGVSGAGTITSANLNAHVDDATIKATFISTKAERVTTDFADNIVVEAGGTLYRAALSRIYETLIQPGGVIQSVFATPYVANADIATVIPSDDTIPQITEGTQILTLTITPRSSLSKIRLISRGFGSAGAILGLGAALFRVGLADCLQMTEAHISVTGHRNGYTLDFVDSPGVLTATTYTVRVGPTAAGTLRMNGITGGRLYGGKAACTLVAQEIKQ